MELSALRDAFAHHVWATLRLLDSCEGLDGARLERSIDGTYGSILRTARHLVGADAFYLRALGVDDVPWFDEESLNLAELRSLVVRMGSTWSEYLTGDQDLERVVEEHEADGYERSAPVSLRLAQALHHGTDHRSQICTALTSLGVEPPIIDVWEYGLVSGRIVESFPPG